MGTSIASDIVSENHVCNEQKLWRHVILNAFEDVKLLSGDRKSSLNKCDSHFWIIESKDFEQICWWAGWEPENVRYRYTKALKEGLIKFKRRHFLWHEYNKLFKRLKEETNIELRRELRRNIENKRRQIMDADNVYVEKFLNDLSHGG
tara:strand:+ start:2037 stop:2480 length:444 start_codon:yes stop_codon:yes gene_type:complete